jgi:putative peptide zinc metalloprotease protein
LSAGVSCKRCRRPLSSESVPASGFVHCQDCNYTFPAEAGSTGEELALRQDLVVVPLEEDASSYYVIKDPENGRYFRIKPLEHFLITLFDGKTSLETIRRRASEEKNVLVSEEVLSRFAEKFRELGLLVNDDEPLSASPTGTRSPDVFHLKLPLANPERLLDWLYPKVRWCFSGAFVGIALGLVLVAAALAIIHRGELAFGLASVVSLEGLVFVLVTITFVTALHELAHGVTCRHFGGRVEDMGFLLLYFLPCFYCNVGDTYLFREKRQRLWVFFAGGFFELVLWALAVVGWRVVAPGTTFSRALFVVAAISALRGLFNFNPLIKMDGYFMVSEYLGVKNLRREAFLSLARALRHLFGIDSDPAPSPLVERQVMGVRGDRFLALFGGAALAYTVILVAGVVLYSGGFVFESFGPDGLGIFSLALLGLLHKPALTAASAAKDTGKEKWQKLGEGNKRRRFVLLWLVVGLVVVFFPWELRVPSELKVLPQERELVRATASGRILHVHAREGAHVDEGDLILEYDPTELDLERRTKEAELSQATEQLHLLSKQSPTVREEIHVKERALETARKEEEKALQNFERMQQLVTPGLVSREAFDGAKSDMEAATARTREAEAEIELVRKSSPTSRTEEMERTHLLDAKAQEARIEKLEAELARLDDLLRRSKIFASISGTLTTYRFQEKVGNYLEEGADVCEIVNDDRVVIEMPVSEKEIDVIEAGRMVKFKVRGYPWRSFVAKVDEVAAVARPSGPNGEASTILVRAYVDNAEKLLKPGMTGVAKIYCGMSFVGHIFTRDIIRFIRTEFWL